MKSLSLALLLGCLQASVGAAPVPQADKSLGASGLINTPTGDFVDSAHVLLRSPVPSKDLIALRSEEQTASPDTQLCPTPGGCRPTPDGHYGIIVTSRSHDTCPLGPAEVVGMTNTLLSCATHMGTGEMVQVYEDNTAGHGGYLVQLEMEEQTYFNDIGEYEMREILDVARGTWLDFGRPGFLLMQVHSRVFGAPGAWLANLVFNFNEQ